MTRVAGAAAAAAAAAAVLGLAGAPAALAQPTRIAVDRGAPVTVAPVAPARTAGRGVALPTAAVTISGARAAVAHEGGLRIRARGRTALLRAVRVTVGPRSSLSARVGRARRRMFVIAAPATRRTVDPGGTSITRAPLRLTRAGAAVLRVEPGRIGTIDLDADATTAPTGPAVTGPATPGGATITARPAGAAAIAGGQVRWSPRASWLGYLQQGEGTAGEAGASFDGMTFTLPISGGWYDPATGRGVVETTGTTSFRYRAHEIDLAYGTWTYDLAAPTPKAVATVERGAAGRRPIQLVKDVTPATTADGVVTWRDLPLTLSAEGVELFRAYLYDSDQGRLTIEASLG